MGLKYPHLKRMTDHMNEMVAAWLNCEDNVTAPSWASLISALDEIGLQGTANHIGKVCISITAELKIFGGPWLFSMKNYQMVNHPKVLGPLGQLVLHTHARFHNMQS